MVCDLAQASTQPLGTHQHLVVLGPLRLLEHQSTYVLRPECGATRFGSVHRHVQCDCVCEMETAPTCRIAHARLSRIERHSTHGTSLNKSHVIRSDLKSRCKSGHLFKALLLTVI